MIKADLDALSDLLSDDLVSARTQKSSLLDGLDSGATRYLEMRRSEEKDLDP